MAYNELGILEEELPPGFNLGMSSEALGNSGLLNLPGAMSTVANPVVAETLSRRPEGLSIADLYKQALGREADTSGLEYWTGKIGPTAEGSEIEEFLQAAQPELLESKYTPFSTFKPIAQEPTASIPSAVSEPETKPVAEDVPVAKSTTVADIAAQQEAAKPSELTAEQQNFPKFEGTPYDPKAYDTLVKQLTAQQKALASKGVPYKSTFGGETETIDDMAKRLAAMGISDIRDFGQKFEIPVEKEEPYLVYQDEGAPISVDSGKYKTIEGIEGYTSENEPIYKYRYLTDDEVKNLRKGQSGNLSLPIDSNKAPDNPYASTIYYNKKTGKELDTKKFGSKAESGVWGSSGSGDGYTNYRVMYTKDGIPVFMPQKQYSGMKEFITEDLQGLLKVASFIPGAQIPVMIAQAAAAAHMGADPKDILKNMATSFIAGNIGKIANVALPEMGFDLPTSDLGKMAMSAGTSGLASLIQGASPEDALKSAVIGGASKGLSGLLPESQPGGLDYNKIIRAAAPAIASGKLTNADIFRLISAAASKKRPPRKG